MTSDTGLFRVALANVQKRAGTNLPFDQLPRKLQHDVLREAQDLKVEYQKLRKANPKRSRNSLMDFLRGKGVKAIRKVTGKVPRSTTVYLPDDISGRVVRTGPFYSESKAHKVARKIPGAEVIGDGPWQVVHNPTKKKGSRMATKKRKKSKNAKRPKAFRRRSAVKKPRAKSRTRKNPPRRSKPTKLTFPFPVTIAQKKKLKPWITRLTGRRVKVK
jgi:hypothetical protein